ncbi:MAG: ABC transporter substrate-binding protein, partial [Phycisphaerales bacterium]
MTARIIILVLFVLTLAAPMALQGGRTPVDPDARPLIIITPHNEQIRHEFGLAFAKWHEDTYGEPAVIRWSVPGGTSEIRRMLIAQYEGAIEDGREPGGNADMVFGGGSYEHGELKKGVTATAPDGREVTISISAPVDFPASRLESIYGQPNQIGDAPLYDPDRHWFGTAVSGFGILWNRDALADAFGTVSGQPDAPPDPSTWADLTAPELYGWVALVNPAQSGSITTAFDAILQREGWTRGWQILRRAAANSRYFSASSLKPPTDVTQGDAAMGICIDFYGRYQAQAMVLAGDPDRLGYADPPGATVIDPDPISMLRGAPDPELAKRFIEFCLTEQAQSLWQFPARGRVAATSQAGDSAAGPTADPTDGPNDDLGPDRFELRRLPILRSMYEEFPDRMIDQARPYEIARAVESPNRAIRSFIAPIFSAM